MLGRDNTRIKQLSEEIGRLIIDTSTPIVAVYLHGSWGSVFERTDSDVDLAVLAQRQLSLEELLNFARRVESFDSIQHDCDLVDLWCADTVFAALVITSGQRLFTEGIEADQFEVKTLSSYARLNEERAAILHEIVQRGSVYPAPSKEL